MLRSLQLDYDNPSPYKARANPPIFDLPGARSPHRIRADPTHTYAIGYGKDEVAGIVLTLEKVGHFGRAGQFQSRLDNAFQKFATFCKRMKKNTSITCFTKQDFKIKNPGCNMHLVWVVSVSTGPKL